jgi:hypothetical protein
MCAFPKIRSGSLRTGFRVTRAKPWGNVGQERPVKDRKILPQRHQLPGAPGRRGRKTRVLSGFRDGTVFADPFAVK